MPNNPRRSEADHAHPALTRRVAEAAAHYAALFDSLEATLPPGSGERLAVERVWLGREIADVVAGRVRHERFGSWEGLMAGSGFASVPLSGFALSQAKLLLRLHYPSQGYQLRVSNGSFFLGWQNQPLFSVSAWRAN
ncbi:Scarecrow-like protein 18 [Striga hermonthica]|uniref:Scarecrow-like protein 18 n=1 Tax=Striga hermonthica TaxID=68872 RepID=A0A9N7RJP9_STRHE|nr:Scarecrow-like protein 18 [Striga hermonthica]